MFAPSRSESLKSKRSSLPNYPQTPKPPPRNRSRSKVGIQGVQYGDDGFFRAQSFTSLMADLRQDINRVSSFSRCLNGTFH